MRPTLLNPALRSLATLALTAGTLTAFAPGAHAQAPLARPISLAHLSAESPGLAAGKYVVVINLDDNRLYFTRNRQVLWSAPVGTGTGLRLEGPDHQWEFSTPNGIFHVQYKELNPDWIAPDWYFVENNLPVPPANDPKRREPGGLGAAALYLGDGIAIHGTDKPQLLGQRVSHGCIRMSNRDVMRLYNEMQVGSEVVIVGGAHLSDSLSAEARAMARKPAATPRTRPAPDPFQQHLASLSTAELLGELDGELQSAPDAGENRWPEMAAELMRRGSRDDAEALRGLLLEVQEIQGRAVGHEYAAFLAGLFSQSPVPTLRALASLDGVGRARAAAAIVDATMTLYPGDAEDQVAPWPTRRIPSTAVEDDDAQTGWEAIRRAEGAYRARYGTGISVADR